VTLERVGTADGALELRRRGERDFLITLNGRVLMNASAQRSELALASQACARLAGRENPVLLIGGLGMGFTLRAALDALPSAARVVVAELHSCVVGWCRGVLAPLTGGAVLDPRVAIESGDVAVRILRAAASGERFDGILLDLYAGPAGGKAAKRPRSEPRIAGTARAEPAPPPPLGFASLRASLAASEGGPPRSKAAKRPRSEPKASEGGPPRRMDCFQPGMLAAARSALAPGGVYAVWSERPDPGFEKRLRTAGFDAVRSRPGRGGLRHAVYVATASSP
jgi:spermidine synthase